MYETLQFSKVPSGRTPTHQAEEAAPAAPGKADGIYDNPYLSPVAEGLAGPGAQQCREPRRSVLPLPLGLLAACLALLVTTITLGVFYWQKEQLLGLADVALVQAQEQLQPAREELVQARQEWNRSQEELQEAKANLLLAQGKIQNLQQQLNTAVRALATARPSQVRDCCPETWVLYRGKCLFLSKEEKTWEQSKGECEQQSSQLLIPRDWDRTTMPSFLTNVDTSYWIGLRQYGDSRGWRWIDGTLHPEGEKLQGYGSYGAIKGGRIERAGWYGDKCHWICEKLDGCPM
ncbi:C-type lectin domain family 12 member B [Alligator mississippiensis]|uniref:C-type lectin domain family 12 member B-like n=1 Tax=Alligator mississippiensis TaxID=8496 RepID=A0A151NV81_ALLMI|nr:C-type lectin domain family 12 member B [Alligator mississippiensis]KYO40664.1 C-type lectin domain family 12 member B-like [Alligator mississippiensis]